MWPSDLNASIAFAPLRFSLAVEKLKQMDDGFRQQLKVKETSHQASLTAMKTQHQHELDAANDNVRI